MEVTENTEITQRIHLAEEVDGRDTAKRTTLGHKVM